jgi:hypothetical protein
MALKHYSVLLLIVIQELLQDLVKGQEFRSDSTQVLLTNEGTVLVVC